MTTTRMPTLFLSHGSPMHSIDPGGAGTAWTSLGRSLGKSLAEFKRASNELRNTLEEEIRIEDQKAAAPKAAEPPTAEAEAHAEEVAAAASGRVDKSA